MNGLCIFCLKFKNLIPNILRLVCFAHSIISLINTFKFFRICAKHVEESIKHTFRDLKIFVVYVHLVTKFIGMKIIVSYLYYDLVNVI